MKSPKLCDKVYMQSKYIDASIKYDGSQLRSLYAYLEHQVLGDSIISWQGPCDVALDHMVDGEDVLQNSEIKAKNMLHFIVEIFEVKLLSAVCLQRLLAEIIISYVQKNSKVKELSQKLIRCGDDIYCDDKKMNISIATVSPSSCLIHFAVNIDGEGAPVKTLSLNELKIEPKPFANDIMKIFVAEFQHIKKATQKVKWVK